MRGTIAATQFFISFLAFTVSTGCYGKRTAIITKFTDETGAPLQYVGVRVYPMMRILPSFPVTWGATNAEGEATLNVPQGYWQLFFDWDGEFYKAVIRADRDSLEQPMDYDVHPESNDKNGRVVRVRQMSKPQ
jgi:hypothetical protein